jgi:hypothetical protein
MILKSETGRLIGAAAPELHLAATSLRMSISVQKQFRGSRTLSTGWETAAANFGQKSGLVVAPF